MRIFKETRLRDLITSYAIPLFSSIFVIFILYYAYTIFIERARFSVFFILFALTVSIFKFMGDPHNSFFRLIKEKWLIIAGFLLSALSISTTLYLILNFNDLSWRVGANTTIDYIFALILLIPILLMAWKSGGSALIILILISLFYMIFGLLFPDPLKHAGFNIKELLAVQVLGLADSGLLCAATAYSDETIHLFRTIPSTYSEGNHPASRSEVTLGLMFQSFSYSSSLNVFFS